jgi:drug/metabolite transporter (DMT)-like permease
MVGRLSLVPAILAGGAAIMAIAGILFFREAPSSQRIIGMCSPLLVCFCCANSFRSRKTQVLARNSAHRFNKRYDVRAIFWPFVLLLPFSR